MGNKTGAVRNSAQHERFALEYLKDFNATQAAIRAGASPRSAAVTGHRWLRRANVQEMIAMAQAARNVEVNTDAEKVLRMIVGVAEADPNLLIEMRRGCCRYCHGQGGQYQFTREEWRKEMERWTADNEHRNELISGGAKLSPLPPLDTRGGIGFNPNNPPNKDCTECWGEGESRPFINDTRTLPENVRRLFGGIKQTQHGVEVKLNSQDKARELLALHTGVIKKGAPGFGGDLPSPGSTQPAPMIVRFVQPSNDAESSGAAPVTPKTETA